jgi:hypothetical protein
MNADEIARFRPPNPPPSPPPSPPPAPSGNPSEASEPARASLRDRLDGLRERATAGRRPLGSPEGRATTLAPTRRSSSPASSRARRRTLDGLAVSVRGATVLIDRVLGSEARDWVATAQEAYEIAAPIAGYLLDRTTESETAAQVVDHVGLIGALMRAAGWLARVFTGGAGGRAEEEETRAHVHARMTRAATRQSREPDRGAPADLGERDDSTSSSADDGAQQWYYRDFVTLDGQGEFIVVDVVT